MMPAQPQPSQQSFSQGVSSQQNVMFSQNSFDEFLAENQRFGSQEKDNSVKRLSCLAPNSYPREEGQLPISRSSSNLTRRWNSTVPDHECQLNDELERKFATTETLLSRLGMVLDSVQSDIMQVNKVTKELSLAVEGIRQKLIAHDDSLHLLVNKGTKGTKELSLAVEGICQKLIAQDDSLHLLNQGQEEMKTSLDVGLRSFSNQLNNISQMEKMQEITSTVTTLPDQIHGIVHQQAEELSGWLSKDLKAIYFSLNTLNQKHLPLANLAPKVTAGDSSVTMPLFTKVTGDSSVQQPLFRRNKKQRRISPLARPPRIVVSLDDDSDDYYLLAEKELADLVSADDLLVDEEAEQILRKARRRKRKQDRKRSS